ncbi:exonuclease V-like [Tubulanus polymorphus]|uniref:exonuclease V-like n=1 Tax=Tubulanus polymorphus TaxID=672921 RepID=UPI003DA660F8
MAEFEDQWGDEISDDVLILAATEIDREKIKINENHEGGVLTISCSSLLEKRSSKGQNPLERIRGGYLWVSDLISQSWCEHQMIYKLTGVAFLVPQIIPPIEESKIVTAGSNLHLARELEVHDVVKIKTTSDEDIFAVKVLNLLTSIDQLLQGAKVCREVPIFGAPFGKDVFFMGIIDELRCDPETMEIELLEFKTRNDCRMPSKSQKHSHHLQVLLYKELFNDIVKGNLMKEVIAQNFRLDLEKEFGEEIMKLATKHIIGNKECGNLDLLLESLFTKSQCLTCINSVLIEYCHQANQTTIGFDQVENDEQWIKKQYDYYMDFWLGRREPSGVDIEEAWKCQRCDFSEICDWREQKAKLCGKNNQINDK